MSVPEMLDIVKVEGKKITLGSDDIINLLEHAGVHCSEANPVVLFNDDTVMVYVCEGPGS